MMDELTRRKALKRIIRIMVLAIFAWLAWVVSGYMSRPGDSQSQSRFGVDLMGLAPGEYMIVRWNRRKLYVWHRTNEMLARLRGHEDQLQDPDSSRSNQPAAAANHYRSMDPRYLVVFADSDKADGRDIETAQQDPSDIPVSPWFGGFWNPCSEIYYDLAGRSYASQGRSRNLAVPAHQIIAGKLYLEND